jgi:probable rRNA maturation factor
MLPDPDIRFFRLPTRADRTAITQFSDTLRKRVTKGRHFACLITTDAELKDLNRTWRGKNYPTDVLSFPIDGEAAYAGDVAISWQRAREQAREFGHSIETEIQVLMLHGVLHLMGMDHETDDGRMSRTETRWRRALGLPAGLIERAHA